MRMLLHGTIKPAIISLLLLCQSSTPCKSQRAKIDSLKYVIASLSGKGLINALNTLSLAYSYLNPDSCLLYQKQAYQLAKELHYEHGIGAALNNQAHLLGIAFHQFPLEEKICIGIIDSFKMSDNNVSEYAFVNLALSLFCQGKFDQSTLACKEVIKLSKKIKDYKASGEATALLGSISFETGNYNEAFNYFNEALVVFISTKDDYNTAILLGKIGDLHALAGDSKGALKLYYECLNYPKDPSLTWHPLEDLGDTYYAFQANGESFKRDERDMRTIKSLTIRSNYVSFPKILEAEQFIVSGEYSKALLLLNNELNFSKLHNDRNETMRLLRDIAKAYIEEKNYSKAILYSRLLLYNAFNFKLKQYARDSYQLLSGSYEQLHKTDSAYFYYKNYTAMKDSVAVADFGRKLSIFKAVTENEKKEQEIRLLNKEKLINRQELQINAQNFKSESLLKNILIGGVFALVAFTFIIVRSIRLKQKNEISRHQIVEKELTLQKLETERAGIEIQRQASELEMQALRAQMNPHFIFNCLNSVNRFIIANNAAKAADHLTKFAKLIRMVLEQSGKPLISLEDELACLRLYIDLEMLRFEIPFRYEINTDDINTSSVFIPSLLIQPFVENAIWHGLQGNKNINNKIIINIKQDDDILRCTIIDNGVGRTHTNADYTKQVNNKKSLGIELTRNRLQLIDSSQRDNVGINIYDLKNELGANAGTCVEINVPAKEI